MKGKKAPFDADKSFPLSSSFNIWQFPLNIFFYASSGSCIKSRVWKIDELNSIIKKKNTLQCNEYFIQAQSSGPQEVE